jgi:hypothetical protein
MVLPRSGLKVSGSVPISGHDDGLSDTDFEVCGGKAAVSQAF